MADDLIAIYIWLGIIVAGAVLAHAKGRGVGTWSVLCALFPFPSLLILAFLPAERIELENRRVAEGKGKQCPACGEIMRVGASVCPHCRSDQPSPPEPRQSGLISRA